MPFNPNLKLPGVLQAPFQPQMNRNPSGFGGTLGSLQPQSPVAGATLNSTQFKPAQFAGIAAAGPNSVTDIGTAADPIWLQLLQEQQKQNQLLQQQLAGAGGALGLEQEILNLADIQRRQAEQRRAQSGAYFFVGGL